MKVPTTHRTTRARIVLAELSVAISNLTSLIARLPAWSRACTIVTIWLFLGSRVHIG
jgi:hypothetical protein